MAFERTRVVQACEQQILQSLTAEAFSREGAVHLQPPPLGSKKGGADKHAAYAAELAWRTAALDALQAFVEGHVAFVPTRRQATLCAAIAESLSPIVVLFTDADNKLYRDPLQAGYPATIAAALMRFQLKLLQVHLVMPFIDAFEDSWTGLLALCAAPLQDVGSAGAYATHLTAHSSRAVHQLLLQPALNTADDVIGGHACSNADTIALVRSPSSLASIARRSA